MPAAEESRAVERGGPSGHTSQVRTTGPVISRTSQEWKRKMRSDEIVTPRTETRSMEADRKQRAQKAGCSRAERCFSRRPALPSACLHHFSPLQLPVRAAGAVAWKPISRGTNNPTQ